MKKRVLFLTGFLLLTFVDCRNSPDTVMGQADSAITEPETYPPLTAGLSLTGSTVTFIHWNYALNSDYSVQPFGFQRKKVADTYRVKVIENNYLKVTILPDFGGRILSIYYKPTGHEELYINPVGTPYGRGDGSFYYDWLMVYGGIFPTFPEPEHGKMWLRRWQSSVSAYSQDQVSIRMSITDSLNYPSHPGKFDNGVTGLACEAIVTVYRGRPVVELSLRLSNPRNERVPYEYWTCTTLAPGSVPGKTGSPDRSKIIAPITRYEAGWSPGNWLGSPGSLYDYSRIDTLSKWTDMGIAYAVNLNGPFWGVINEENKEGIFRIADNSGKTPGMKFWTWGRSTRTSVDPAVNSSDGRRPYVELWAGHSHSFFTDAYMDPNQVKSWNETYYPAVGLEDVTFANANGAAFLSAAIAGDQVDFTARFFSTWPMENFDYVLELTGTPALTLKTGTLSPDPATAAVIQCSLPVASIPAGTRDFRLTVKRTVTGEELLQAAVPLKK
jgi:hypothetical protein